MGVPVNTVAAGGLPVVDVTATLPKLGAPVSEALPGKGVAVTKVASLGLPVTFEIGGVVTPPVTYVTWDPATVSAVTLSGGNLVTTSAGGSTDHGAHVISTSGKTTGKYYFEITLTTLVAGADTGVGLGTIGSSYAGMGGNATVGVELFVGTSNIYANGGSTGINLGASITTGAPVGMAVDLDNRKMWFRKAPSGIWNNNAGYDPAANVGGITIPAGTMVPFCTFNASGNVFTTNFGASAFVGTVPSGFTAGWTA